MKTAAKFFDELAAHYLTFSDYTADISMTVDTLTTDAKTSTVKKNESVRWYGQLFFRKPNRLLIKFTNPFNQVIVSDGDVLQVYVPGYQVDLTQKLDPKEATSAGAGLASGDGLAVLRRGYTVAYKVGYQKVPLEAGSNEMVTKLLLTWRNSGTAKQGFRELEIAVTPSMFIRRIEGITADQRKFRIDYTGISINVGIPLKTFEYDSPVDSNRVDNFLFGNN